MLGQVLSDHQRLLIRLRHPAPEDDERDRLGSGQGRQGARGPGAVVRAAPERREGAGGVN